jgi:hypothetical protein
MAADDIKKHQFTSENQPKRRRSRKGVPNRATVYKNLLELVVDAPDPQRKGYIKLTLYEAMALGQMRAAMQGNTNAWKEIQDSLFGKQLNSVNVNITAEQLKQLSDEELDALIRKLDRGYSKIPQISIIEFKQQFEERKQERLRQVEELDDDGP